MEEHSIGAFTDGSLLDNPGRAGAGAAVHMAGLTSSPLCLKKALTIMEKLLGRNCGY